MYELEAQFDSNGLKRECCYIPVRLHPGAQNGSYAMLNLRMRRR
jgi:hypothetical protein